MCIERDSRDDDQGQGRRSRFRWPSPRTLLWLHIGVVCYTGAVVHLGIHNYLQMPGFNISDSVEISQSAKVVSTLLICGAMLLGVTLYLFPLAMVISLYQSEPSWRLALCVVVEALLVYAHIASIYPWAIHVY